MHSLHHLFFAVLLMLGCGFITAKFFSYQLGAPFSLNGKLVRNRYFWLGIMIAMVFLWSDIQFEHAFSLPAA